MPTALCPAVKFSLVLLYNTVLNVLAAIEVAPSDLVVFSSFVWTTFNPTVAPLVKPENLPTS